MYIYIYIYAEIKRNVVVKSGCPRLACLRRVARPVRQGEARARAITIIICYYYYYDYYDFL